MSDSIASAIFALANSIESASSRIASAIESVSKSIQSVSQSIDSASTSIGMGGQYAPGAIEIIAGEIREGLRVHATVSIEDKD